MEFCVQLDVVDFFLPLFCCPE